MYLQFYTVTYGIARISKMGLLHYVTVRCKVVLKFDFVWQLLKELKLFVEFVFNHNSVKICETGALRIFPKLC